MNEQGTLSVIAEKCPETLHHKWESMSQPCLVDTIVQQLTIRNGNSMLEYDIWSLLVTLILTFS